VSGSAALALFAVLVVAGIAAALFGRRLVADGQKTPGWIAIMLAVLLVMVGAAGVLRSLDPPQSDTAAPAFEG
jgi:uncharacterized membrane protein YhhN